MKISVCPRSFQCDYFHDALILIIWAVFYILIIWAVFYQIQIEDHLSMVCILIAFVHLGLFQPIDADLDVPLKAFFLTTNSKLSK